MEQYEAVTAPTIVISDNVLIIATKYNEPLEAAL